MGNWRKSSFSNANGGDCVEVASDSAVMVRDTADRDGVMLAVSTDVWRAFLRSLR